ncbi:hypothetical protein ACFQZF_01565 [Flavobacterium myungsuense]|uniref:Lipoprotein n=1 Tax=Flavobacterium myungsuense TaxID=651823 RepID=A0ABW3J2I6_9FLAO
MKILYLIITLILLTSCAPRRVCGGSGGKRCVETTIKSHSKTIS